MKPQLYILSLIFFLTQFHISQAQFLEPLNGPMGISISEIEISTDGHIYIITPYRGILRSIDNGLTWESFMNGVPDDNFYHGQLTASPNGEMYFITEESFYRLPPGGTTWISKFVSGLAFGNKISVNKNGNIYVGLNNKKLFFAESGTDAFQQIGDSPISFNGLRTYGNDQNFVWYNNGFVHQLYRFSDDGSQFEQVSPTLTNFENIEDIDILENGKLLLSTAYGLWESTDNANSWTYIDINADGENDRIFSSHIHPSGDLYFLTNKGVYLSDDDGITFQLLNGMAYDDLPGTYLDIAFTDQSDIFFSGVANFFYHSKDDGLTWERIDTKFKYPQTLFITKDLEDNLYARTKKIDGMEKSEDDGVTWEAFKINDERVYSVDFHENGDYFATTYHPDYTVHRSSDKGQNWTDITPQLPNAQFADIAVGPNGRIYLKARNILLISENLGESWTTHDFSIVDLVFPPAFHPSGDIYMGSRYGTYKSIDNGDNWIKLIPDITPNPTNLQAPHFSSTGKIFMPIEIENPNGFPGYAILVSDDNGDSFELFQDHPSFLGHDMIFLCDCDDNMIFAKQTEIYISYDGGQNWEDIGLNIDSKGLIEHLYLDKKNQLYVGTLFDVIYKSKNPTCDFVDSTNEYEKPEINIQVSPNPMGDFTVIQIEDEIDFSYVFKVFSVTGTEIRSENINTNVYKLNKENLHSGIYFYQIESENNILKTGKLIIK